MREAREKWGGVAQGVLQYYQNQKMTDADVSPKHTAEEFENIAEGKTKLDDAITSGDVKLKGSHAKLDEFLALFDAFDPWYNSSHPSNPSRRHQNHSDTDDAAYGIRPGPHGYIVWDVAAGREVSVGARVWRSVGKRVIERTHVHVSKVTISSCT